MMTRRALFRHLGCGLAPALAAGLSLGSALLGTTALSAERGEASQAQPPTTLPGAAAPAEMVRELQSTLALAIKRFETRDVPGVLTYVSDQYRTGPLTKAGIREQIILIYSVYEALRASIRIDEVQMVGEHAWVYSTGEVSGRLPWVGRWVVFLSWQRELEVARREGGAWRLFGYQQ